MNAGMMAKKPRNTAKLMIMRATCLRSGHMLRNSLSPEVNITALTVCAQPPTPAVNVALPAFAAERRAAVAVPNTAGAVAAERRRLLSIDITCPQDVQQSVMKRCHSD